MARTKKLRVGVLFGGRSGEHEISLRSALTVMSAMDARRYEIVPIGIGRDGRWLLQTDALRMLAAATPKLGALGRGGLPVSLLPHPDGRALVSIPTRNGRGHLLNGHSGAPPALPGPLDVIFPVLHGTYGEDGTVQGLLDLAGIPYVGAGVLGSAVGMDKDAQKRLLASTGLPVVRYCPLTRSDYLKHPAIARREASKLGWPVFVKPNALGSSIGVTKVASARKLGAALEDAFQYDRKVLIEAACEGRELECAVLGNDDPAASVPGEILVKAGHDFYSYDSKYVDPDGADVKIPADLPVVAAQRIRDLSVAAFKALSLRGMARVDFLARADLSEIYVNEVNTIPGFTSISMYPKLWEASGVPLPQLIDRLIEFAIEHHRDRAGLKFTYQPHPDHT
ncbi:MAG: D-alanine--D-alanine ligase family protein [Candidatus Binataceae bacterium]|jgi:D-alanine-D-alanine ligase